MKREDKPWGMPLHKIFGVPASRIVDTRFDQKSNALVIRNLACQFYLVKNVAQLNMSSPCQEFQSSTSLEELADGDESIISDYLLIPAEKSGSRRHELLVADPYEGFHILQIKSLSEHMQSEDAPHHKDFSRLCHESAGATDPIGQIKHFSLSADNKMIAIYANQDQGDLIVLKHDLSTLYNKITTGMVGAENVIWCGSDVTALEYVDKVILVGPKNECLTLDLGSPTTNGLKCLTENDGLRIVNSEGVFFLERVQEHVVKTLRIASIEPAAKLLSAVKFVDQKIPKADEIIRELSKEKLVDGIETLLEVAKLEHWDVAIMKHLLRTASFAKKFTDKTDFEQDRYVNVVNHLIVLTKLRYSKVCARAITYDQFEKYKPKHVLKLLYRYRDYKLALQLIEFLNFKQYLPQVYEDWTITMLKHTQLKEHELKERLRQKFESLRTKIAAE